MTMFARHCRLPGSLLVVLCLAATAQAQDPDEFDEIAAVEELAEIEIRIESEDATNPILAEARGDVLRIETGWRHASNR